MSKFFYSQSTGTCYIKGFHSQIPADAKEISSQVFNDVILNPPTGKKCVHDENGLPILVPIDVTIEQLANTAQRKVDAEYTRRMSELASSYPVHERESWPVQQAEARDLQADENAVTPWINQCATKRGITRTELAARILQKDAAYRQVSGSMTGIRQWHEDQIHALLEAGEISRQALQAYDITQGWSSADLWEPQSA